MDKRRQAPLAEQLAAARDWWRDAGVDQDFANEPHNWLAQAVADPVEDSLSIPT